MLTATTYIKPYKKAAGKSAIQTMEERFAYGLNPEKLGALSSYLCDPATAHAEFLLTKSQYQAETGRAVERGALFFQIRQAFPKGEVTPEDANKIGYETAMRWTKGKYQFFVCTHIDKGHIHNHIYYNATAYDCSRKFHNFIGSTFALRRLSDRVCIEHDLSYIQNPAQHSKGRFLHYGQWIGERPPSYKQRLCFAITDALKKGPADFDAFLRLMEESGYEVRHGRGGVISFLVPGQEHATRLRESTLGEGFDPEDIRAVIAGRRPAPEIPTEPPAAPRRVNLIIDIQERMRSGKGPAYERWAKIYNLKQMAAALQFLQEHMYRPSVSSNGEYIFRKYDGKWLDPDKILSAHPNWRDVTTLPTSSRESAVIQRDIKRQADPLAKDGIIGAFCRTYGISSVIDKFLADIYVPSAVEGRYDYIKGTSAAGVVVYDDKFAYSHHASDPAYGKLLNAFDLVRTHLFGDLDEKASFKEMSDLAVKDEAVSDLLLEERRQKASSDFMDDENWASRLTRTKQGEVENTLSNLLLILNMDKSLVGIRYNKLASQIYGEGLPWERQHPAWREADTAQLVAYIDAHYGEFTARNYELAITKVSDDRAYHPILEYLNALPSWDNRQRVNTFFIDYLGAEDTAYTQAVTRKTLVAAIARVKHPGIKFDNVPVLNGPQGIGKSMAISRLGREWYSDSLSISDMKDKTAPEKLQGHWLLELSEMAGIKKMDVETVKSFASRVDDKYRPSYGRVVESHPRQCIIIGTTNNDGGFLRDVTGNRRFWPIRVTGKSKKHPWDLIEKEVEQIWAEAIALFEAGEELYLTGDVAVVASDEQRGAMENDDREGLVVAYLEALLPVNWDTMDIYARQEYFRSPDDPTKPEGTIRRVQVSNMEIWCECFGRHRDALKKTDSYEIEAIVNSIGGWERYTGSKTGKKNIPLYGPQKIYVREK